MENKNSYNITGIYKISSTCKPNHIYIGSAMNIGVRWNRHLGLLRSGKHHSCILQNHFSKYGEPDLQFSVLVECDKGKLIELEQYFINSYNPCFNICKIAGSSLGRKHTIESKAKMSKSATGNTNALGHIVSDESRKLMSENGRDLSGENNPMYGVSMSGELHWNYGRKYSDEFREKLRIAHLGIPNPNKGKKGRPVSEDQKRRQSIAMTGHKASPEACENMRLGWIQRKINKEKKKLTLIEEESERYTTTPNE